MEFKTPPLNALRAFDAIVRTRSISKAAAVLDVTQSAISQQQKLLETYLGVHLFSRDGKQLKLTREGEIYAKQVNSIFDNIRLATEELLHQHLAENVLVINIEPELATQLLLPKLSQFHAKYPQIEIRISSPLRSMSRPYEDIDIGIYTNLPQDCPACKSLPMTKIDHHTIYFVYLPSVERKEKFICFRDWLFSLFK